MQLRGNTPNYIYAASHQDIPTVKLAAVIEAIAPFLATDKKPDEVKAAILAADKKAKDAAGSGLGSRELEEGDRPGAKDVAMDAREAACDEREATMDAAEEKADEGKVDDKAKDRKSARDKRAKDRADRKMGRDKAAKDRSDDPEHTNDENYMEGADPSTPGGSRAGGKTAIDSAEADRRIAAAIAARDALHAARTDVQPILGVTAFDSAGATYAEALKHLGVATDGIPESAFGAMLALAKKSQPAAPMGASDAATVSNMAKLIPNYNRLR
jgi:hypothetical protein